MRQFPITLLFLLRQFFQRPSVQAAAKNFGWLVAARGGRLVLGAIVGFWVARYLGPVHFGVLSYCTAWVALFGVVPELGLEAVVKRRLISQPATGPAVLATTVGLRLGAALIAAIGLALATWLLVKDAPERRLVGILGFLLLQPVWLSWDHWFQARLQARVSVLAQTSAFAIGAVLRIGLIFLGAPVMAFAGAIVLESMLAGIILIGLGRSAGLRLKWRDFNPAWGRELLAESWPLLLGGMAILVYTRIDAVMLRSMAGEKAVGIYSAAVRFSEMGYFLPIALASSLLPALLRRRAAGPASYEGGLQRYYDLNAGCAYALTLPMVLLAPWLTRMAYGMAYEGAGPILAVHAWANLFVFLGVARGQFIVNEGLTRFTLYATVAGAGLNILLNLLLIPKLGAIGAACATLAAQVAAAWLSSFCFTPLRVCGWMQAKALLIPLRWHCYVSPTS